MAIAVNGVNIAVKDLAGATERYERVFGVKGEYVGEDGFAFPGMRGSRLDVNGFVINLITSEDEGTSVSRFLERNGEGIFLMSTKVEDIDEAVEQLKELGLSPLLREAARGGYGAVNFFHPRDMNGVQLELMEPPEG